MSDFNWGTSIGSGTGLGMAGAAAMGPWGALLGLPGMLAGFLGTDDSQNRMAKAQDEAQLALAQLQMATSRAVQQVPHMANLPSRKDVKISREGYEKSLEPLDEDLERGGVYTDRELSEMTAGGVARETSGYDAVRRQALLNAPTGLGAYAAATGGPTGAQARAERGASDAQKASYLNLIPQEMTAAGNLMDLYRPSYQAYKKRVEKLEAMAPTLGEHASLLFPGGGGPQGEKQTWYDNPVMDMYDLW